MESWYQSFFCLFNIQNSLSSPFPSVQAARQLGTGTGWDSRELQSERQLPCPTEAGAVGDGGLPPGSSGVSLSLSQSPGGKLLPFGAGDPQKGAEMVLLLGDECVCGYPAGGCSRSCCLRWRCQRQRRVALLQHSKGRGNPKCK